jgi:hypothetical protein
MSVAAVLAPVVTSLSIGAVPQQPAPVTVIVTSPVANGLFFTGTPAEFAGTATSALPISAVSWSLTDETTGLSLQSSGVSWGKTVDTLDAAFTEPTAGDASWTAAATLASGQYRLTVRAENSDGASSSSVGVLFDSGPAPTLESPGYLTIMFGRSNWVPSVNCVPVPGAPTLMDVAQTMAAMGLVGTGAVVTNTIGTTPTCSNFSENNQNATWADLRALQALGWDFVSASETYVPYMTSLGYATQVTDSCGSLTNASTGLYAHGFDDAWGMFAYPSDKFTNAIQTNPVSTCFAFGRTYQAGRNIRSGMKAPWLQRTTTISGGRCNDPTLPCYTVAVTGCATCDPRYTAPSALATLVKTAGDEWTSIQFYRFLVGAGTDGTLSWDCTSPNWEDHYTTQGETYCYNDFLSMLASIPPNVITVDPAYVAEAWGDNVKSNG